MDDPIRAAFCHIVSDRRGTGSSYSPRDGGALAFADYDLDVRSEREWKRLTRLLLSRGTVAPHEFPVLEIIWRDACESARAVGDLGPVDADISIDSEEGSRARGRNPVLTFSGFQRRLLELYEKPGVQDIESALVNLESSTKTLSGTFASWDVDSLNEIQLRELLLAVDELDLSGEHLLSGAAAREQYQRKALSLQPVQTLFWDVVDGPAQLERAVRARDAPTALKYQAHNSSAINRRCRENKIATIRGIYFAAKNSDGSPRPQPLDDPFGHAAGCGDGVTCSLALSAASAGRDRVELISVPRSGASGRTMVEILRTFEVHRQLSLSPRFPQILGCDDTSDSEWIHFMYDYARGISAHELLCVGGPLAPSSPLFRFIISEVLEAFVELEERCTFALRGRITSHNIIVAEAGTAVRLGHLPLGDELSSFSNGSEVALFQAQREALLVHSFGDIVTELLLGPSSEAGRGPVSKRHGGGDGNDLASRGLKPATIYEQNACRAGVHVRPGERFTLMLPADTSQGYTWDTPTILNDDRSTVAIVRFQGMDPKTAEGSVAGGGDGMAMFSIQFVAVQTGSCDITLVRKRPWDTSVSKEEEFVVHVSVHEEGLDPSYAAVVRACTEGFRQKLEMLDRSNTQKNTLREPWQRQPVLRELRRHPLVSCSAARDTPDVDTLITAFERHVDYV